MVMDMATLPKMVAVDIHDDHDVGDDDDDDDDDDDSSAIYESHPYCCQSQGIAAPCLCTCSLSLTFSHASRLRRLSILAPACLHDANQCS